jgi:hypothetical protein
VVKEAVTFACQHTCEIELPINSKARATLRAHLETQCCRDCRYQHQIEEARQRANAFGLASLYGTPRQIAYALVLRDQQVRFFLEQFQLAERADPHDPTLPRRRARFFSAINAEQDATWWIEHRELQWLRCFMEEEDDVV